MSVEKRDLILEVAKRRMLHYGVQKTSVHEIAKDAGMAVGTLYNFFKNKEDLVLSLADEYREQQFQMAEDILNSELPPEGKITTYLLNRFEFVRQFRESGHHGQEFVKVLLRIRPEAVENWRERMEYYLTQYLAEGKKQGLFQIADPAHEARILFLAVQSFYPLPYLELPQWPNEEELVMVLNWFIAQWKRS